MERVLVTGADGFVGAAVVRCLLRQGYAVRAAARSERGLSIVPAGCERRLLDVTGPFEQMAEAVRGIDQVVHLAALVHTRFEAWRAAAFHRTNAGGTASLARIAAECGVRRFLLLSTVGVNGRSSKRNGAIHRYAETDIPQPLGAYARSKYAAEQALQALANNEFGIVIVRAPLIFGPRAKSNFLSLLRHVDRGLPVPVSQVPNPRSTVYVDSLAFFIERCLHKESARNQVFLVADFEQTVAGLVSAIAVALDRKPRLWTLPESACRVGLQIPGLRAPLQSLTEPLLVDTAKAQATIGWTSQTSLQEAIEETVKWYRAVS